MKFIYRISVLILALLCVLARPEVAAQDFSTVSFDDLSAGQQIKGLYMLELDDTGDYIKEMPGGELAVAPLDASDTHFYFWIIEHQDTKTFQLHSASTSSSIVTLANDGSAMLTSDFDTESSELMLRMDPAGPLRTLPLDDSSPEAIGSIVTESISDYAGIADCECYGLSFEGSHRIVVHRASFTNHTYVGFPFESTNLSVVSGQVDQSENTTYLSVSGNEETLNFVSSQFYVAGFGANDFELTIGEEANGTVGFMNYLNHYYTPDVYQYAKPEIGIRFDEGGIYLYQFGGNKALPSTTEIVKQEVFTDFDREEPIYFGFANQNLFSATQGDKTVVLTTTVPAEHYLNQSVSQRTRILAGLDQGDVNLAYTMKNGLINSASDLGTVPGNNLVSTNPYLPYNKGEELINTFDWQDSKWWIRYNGGPDEGEAVFSPYYDNSSAELSSISAKYDSDNGDYLGGEDFSPLEGWELLKSNLGYYANGAQLNPAPEYPHVIMYDRINSTMRVFVFANNSGESNQLQVSLGVRGKSPTADPPGPGSTDYQPLLWGSLQQYKTLDEVVYGDYSKTTKLKASDGRQWYFYDFVMEFDPCVSFFETSIIIDIHKISHGTMSLMGRSQGGTIPAGSETYDDWINNQDNYLLGVMDVPFGAASKTLGDISMNQMKNFGLQEFETSLEATLVGSDIPEWKKQEAKMLWEAQALQADQDEDERAAAAQDQVIGGVTSVLGGFGGLGKARRIHKGLDPSPWGPAIGGITGLASGIFNIVDGINNLNDDSELPSRKLAYAKKLHYDNIKDKVKEDDQSINIPVPEPRPNIVFGELALTGEMTTKVELTKEFMATPGGLNSDQGAEWHLDGSRGAAPLYNNPMGKFTMLNKPEFAVAVSRSGDTFSAYLKIKEKPYFAVNDKISGKEVDVIKVSINVETSDGGPLTKNLVSKGYTTLFDGTDGPYGSLPAEMDITHLLDQEMLKANFDNAADGTDLEMKLSEWILISYDVWSLTLTSLKGRNNQRVMANASQYFDGTTSFVYQELQSGLSSCTLASQNKTLSNNTAEFSAYDFGDHADFGNSYTISNVQTNFKEVMYNYCTAQNSGIEPDTLSTPYLKYLGARTVDELNELSFNAVLRNEDEIDETQTISYALDATSIASGMTIDEVSGAFSWTPTESHDGTHEVIVLVADDEGRDDRERITIVVNEVNAAPELNEVGDQKTDEQDHLTFTVEASDPDNTNQTLTFTLDETSIANGMTLGASSGVFEWTPDESQDGEHSVTISVSDGQETASETLNISVAEINAAPVLSDIGDQTTDELAELTFIATASDSDHSDESLTYSLDKDSENLGMAIDASTGLFSWTPTEEQDGEYSVTITVSDGELEDSEKFAVVVNDSDGLPDDEILNLNELEPAYVIYPNPATSVIHIEIENEYRGALEVEVVNISGRLMKHKEVFKNDQTFHLAIDLEELNPSIYFINLKTEHNNIIKKVILQ
ncbi:putative Ig domain-containing protein [Reichenbachiella sp.]|uniref:putative Ig domain-containing protein n=1 Tax=Reichenbachiella sp. TaxID=2184521 RepID=UPI003BAF19A2